MKVTDNFEVIAIALIHLALTVKDLEKRISNGSGTNGNGAEENWWDEFVFHLTRDLINSICHKVREFFSTASVYFSSLFYSSENDID